MKKPATGQKKKNQIKHAKNQFLSKAEKQKRREKFRNKQRHLVNLQKEYNELMNQIYRNHMTLSGDQASI